MSEAAPGGVASPGGVVTVVVVGGGRVGGVAWPSHLLVPFKRACSVTAMLSPPLPVEPQTQPVSVLLVPVRARAGSCVCGGRLGGWGGLIFGMSCAITRLLNTGHMIVHMHWFCSSPPPPGVCPGGEGGVWKITTIALIRQKKREEGAEPLLSVRSGSCRGSGVRGQGWMAPAL